MLLNLVYILAIGFICIAYPIFVFISIWSMPIYVIIAYFIWVFVTIGWIYFSGKIKISEYITPTVIFLIIFTMIWKYSFDNGQGNEYMDDEFLILFAPALNTPAFCFIGSKLGALRIKRIEKKLIIWARKLNDYYKDKIQKIDKIIIKIEEEYFKEKSVENLLCLIDFCTEGKLQEDFKPKIESTSERIISEISTLIIKYSLEIDTRNKTIEKILTEVNVLKEKYIQYIYKEKDIKIGMYKQIKKEYKELKPE